MPTIDDFEKVLKRKGGTDPFAIQDPVEKKQPLFDDADADAPKVVSSMYDPNEGNRLESTGVGGWHCTGCGAFVPWNESHECPALPFSTNKPVALAPMSEMGIAAELKRIADALEKIERKMKRA